METSNEKQTTSNENENLTFAQELVKNYLSKENSKIEKPNYYPESDYKDNYSDYDGYTDGGCSWE